VLRSAFRIDLVVRRCTRDQDRIESWIPFPHPTPGDLALTPERRRGMATRDITTDDRVASRRAMSPSAVVRRQETKPSFMTTEFWAMAGAVAAILVAAYQADNFDAPRAWTLVAAVVIGYMVSRGLAKSGSAHRDRDEADGI
jgi:hypothetical protein